MKTIRTLLAFLLFTVVLSCCISCEKSMDELNVNPNTAQSVNPDYLFTYSVTKGMGSYITNVNVHYWLLMNWEMYFATLGGVDAGKEYNSNDGKDALWTEWYSQALINANEVQRLTAGNSWLVNKHAIAGIWKVYLFTQLSDLFGDIPCTDALKGGTELNFTPSYDGQKDVYAYLISTLKQSVEEMDESKALFPGNSDPIYKGSVAKWKAFANSLRLRLALRMTEVDGGNTARNEVIALQNEPMISSNSENAIFPYNGEIRNPLFDLVNSGQSGGRTYPSKFLIDLLKARNDPRTGVFAQYTTESVIIGAPDYRGVPNLVPAGSSVWSNYKSDASDVSKIGTWFLRQEAPGMLMSLAEVRFLQAEASLRGWWSGNAQQLYEQGVTANLESYTGSGISASQISAYVASLPPVSLEEIITQKWISFTFQNAYEAYAEYRRTGFPVLLDYAGLPINTTTFPNRLTYPATEANLNSAHYNEALARQGADIAATKVWWDKN